MKIAILSDIHSNYPALKAVVEAARQQKIKNFIVLGDFFGYYPWAVDCFLMLQELPLLAVIRGNHDEMMLQEQGLQEQRPFYQQALQQNKSSLEKQVPEYLQWLDKLSCSAFLQHENYSLKLFHGSPDDACNGRYYPDDEQLYDWFPAKDEILLMGHTHYPLLRRIPEGGVIFNPGSVGQARDGNPFPAWGIWDTAKNSFSFERSPYDFRSVILELEKLKWHKRAILALSKDYRGKLKN